MLELYAEVISSLAPCSCFLHLNYSSCCSHFFSGTFISLVPATGTIVPAEVISALSPLCILFPRLELQFLLKSFPLWHLCVSCSLHWNFSSCWSHFRSGTFMSLPPLELLSSCWSYFPLASLHLVFPPLELKFLLKSFPLWHLYVSFSRHLNYSSC